MCSLEVALDNQLILLRVSAADDQVVFAGHKPVELLKPQGLAHVLDGCLGAHLTQLLLRLLLSCLQGLLIGVHCFLLLYNVLLALLIVDARIGICIEVQIKLHLQKTCCMSCFLAMALASALKAKSGSTQHWYRCTLLRMHIPGALHHALLPHVYCFPTAVGFCIDAVTNVQKKTQTAEIGYNSRVLYACLVKIPQVRVLLSLTRGAFSYFIEGKTVLSQLLMITSLRAVCRLYHNACCIIQLPFTCCDAWAVHGEASSLCLSNVRCDKCRPQVDIQTAG